MKSNREKVVYLSKLLLCVCVSVSMCVCVYVCERVRDRERKRKIEKSGQSPSLQRRLVYVEQ